MHFNPVSVMFTKNYSAVSGKCLAFDKKKDDIQYIKQYI